MKYAVAGKGGSGKTTIAAWLGDYLSRRGKNVWLIDADTALSLGISMGLQRSELPTPLIQEKELINERIGEGLISLSPDVTDLPERLAVDIPLGCSEDKPSCENKRGMLRLLVMGTVAQAGEGCACRPNALLKAVLAHLLTTEDDDVVVDLEAGVEHLGRGTIEAVDTLLIVTEPSIRSLETACFISRLAKELGLEKQLLIMNRFSEEQELPEPYASTLPAVRIKVPCMAGLTEKMLDNPSVLNLPEQEKIDEIIAQIVRSR